MENIHYEYDGTTNTFVLKDAQETVLGSFTINVGANLNIGAGGTLVSETMVSDLLFTDATYDIGKSGNTRPRDLFTSRDVSVGRNGTVAGTLAVTGLATLTAGSNSAADTTYTVAAKGPILKRGANGRCGTVALTAGAGTVSNTSVAATDAIILSLNTVGGTVNAAPYIDTLTPGTGFTVKAGGSDTSTYNYTIIKNAA